MVHWKRKWQLTTVFMPQEPHGQYEKTTNMTPEDECPGLKLSDMLSGNSRGQLLLVPEK